MTEKKTKINQSSNDNRGKNQNTYKDVGCVDTLSFVRRYMN